MTDTNNDWEHRLADLWASIEDLDEDEFLAGIDRLADELPAGSPVAAFERASALDSTGHSDRAAPLYQRALDDGLSGLRRRRAVIQMASSLRNVGRAEESAELLTAERGADADELDDAVAAFLALALVDTGREREAVSIALAALAPHLPRYQRSLANYAGQLAKTTSPESIVGDTLADQLRALGTRGVLVQMARCGQIIELRCEMPKCYCPKGRGCFEPRSIPLPDWAPSPDHYPRLKADGGHLVPWNVRLSHVLCNREDYGWRMRIRRMVEKGMSLDEIAENLNHNGIRRPHGSAKWSATSVRKAFVS